MSIDPHLEDSILKPKHKRNYLGLIVIAVLILGVGAFALYIRNAGVSADTLTPPTPAQPTSVTPPIPNDPIDVTPPVPEDPLQPGHFIFPAGWSMVSAKSLIGYSLAKLEAAGIFLYSFNDPDYPTTDWTTFPGTVANKTISLTPKFPLGYYAYNSTTQPISVTLDKQVTASVITSSIFGRGWHLLYWNGNALTKDDLLSKVKITYSDKSVLSGTQAVAKDKHTASLKIYVVVNQNDINLTKSVKELTGTDSATTVSKLPKNSYYWIYLRRTGQRASSVNYGAETPTATATATNSIIVPPVPSAPAQ